MLYGSDETVDFRNCRRPLNKNTYAYPFVCNILQIPHKERSTTVTEIVNAELALEALEKHQTSLYEDYRCPDYMTDDSRLELRKRILSELISFERLENDDDIKLGQGGAKPRVTQSSSIAYIVSGAPASGKSFISNMLARKNGAFILDSDYAKRKLPEYSSFNGGASLVHDESNSIVFAPTDSLFEYCIYSEHNIVIPIVGKTFISIEKYCTRLIDKGYKVHIINVALDRFKSVFRAYMRYKSSGRYVPLSYVFDEVGNEPERVYYMLKRAYEHNESFLSFSQVSTDVPIGKQPIITEYTANSPVLCLFNNF